MADPKFKMAYLAPEIPALSATFVYNEILGLENKGFDILPLSVHVPKSRAAGEKIAGLAGRTRYLYPQSIKTIAAYNMGMLARRPSAYLRTLLQALADSLKVGPATRTGLGLLFRFLAAAQVAGILIRENCRHIHVHFAHIPTDIAMYASGMAGVPFSFTAHANDLFERGWLLPEKVKRARFAVTISEYNRRFLSRTGASARDIHVVHCGVDSGKFDTRRVKPLGDPPKIGILGRMVEKKGMDDLIQACGRLKKMGIPFVLEIAGDGPLEKELQHATHRLGLTPDILFKGPLPHHRVANWLSRLDLFVLPCRKDRRGDMDGIPVVLMEAMLVGVPVISTRISGIPELVENGATGLLARAEAPGDLARVIGRLLSGEVRRTDLCKNAVVKIKSEFDLEKNVDRLAKLFQRHADT